MHRAHHHAGAALLALALLLAPCLACERATQGVPRPIGALPVPDAPDDPASWKAHYAEMASLGDGFIVWESRRAGSWRIWLRPLNGAPERQISPDEPGRDHIAAHVSPDGTHLVYLSLPAPHKSFDPLPSGARAPLHLVRLENGRAAEDRILAPNARDYHQSRAALWVDARRLIYVAGDLTTRQIDIVTGAEEVLIADPRTRYGMLVNATRTHATNGIPTFSTYHSGDHTVSKRKRLPGCQPYFTLDGRFGYWVADAGGPLRSVDLASDATAVMLDRDSPFLPKGHGYVYYPMVSANARLVAFGASRNEQGHFGEDYDVFVAPLDPETLTVTGTAVRYSFSSGEDRFPDVFVAGGELGRQQGEAPFRAVFHPSAAADDAAWRFEYGDGSPPGPAAEHVYAAPGTYAVIARAGARTLSGEVEVAQSSPPGVVRAEVLPGGREIAVLFDERIDVAGASAALGSGAAIASLAAGERGRDLLVTLAQPLTGADTLRVEGVRDRADPPHAMDPAELPIAFAAWPGSGAALAFVFATEDADNSALDLDSGHPRSFDVTPIGRARFDANGALQATGGGFEVDDLPARFAAAFRAAGAFTLEATVTPTQHDAKEPLHIVTLAADGQGEDLLLAQEAGHALLRVRLAQAGRAEERSIAFGQLQDDKPNHLLVTYASGRVTAYQDGRRVLESDALAGDLSTWHDGARLALGSDTAGGHGFAGKIEGVALHTRALGAGEAASHASAYLHALAERAPVPRIRVKARPIAASALPTLAQIAPYREALVLNEYRVPAKKRARLGADTVRVAHWAILDGKPQPVPKSGDGPVALVLEPFERHPQLRGTYLADTLGAGGGQLYLDVGDGAD